MVCHPCVDILPLMHGPQNMGRHTAVEVAILEHFKKDGHLMNLFVEDWSATLGVLLGIDFGGRECDDELPFPQTRTPEWLQVEGNMFRQPLSLERTGSNASFAADLYAYIDTGETEVTIPRLSLHLSFFTDGDAAVAHNHQHLPPNGSTRSKFIPHTVLHSSKPHPPAPQHPVIA
jgi:hypothetical protein